MPVRSVRRIEPEEPLVVCEAVLEMILRLASENAERLVRLIRNRYVLTPLEFNQHGPILRLKEVRQNPHGSRDTPALLNRLER